MFSLDRKTIYNWLGRGDDLAPKLATTRLRKVDRTKLRSLVEATPDARLCDYARTLGVSINAVHYQFNKMNIRKKNDPVRGTKVYGTV
jgi:transposase